MCQHFQWINKHRITILIILVCEDRGELKGDKE